MRAVLSLERGKLLLCSLNLCPRPFHLFLNCFLFFLFLMSEEGAAHEKFGQKKRPFVRGVVRAVFFTVALRITYHSKARNVDIARSDLHTIFG